MDDFFPARTTTQHRPTNGTTWTAGALQPFLRRPLHYLGEWWRMIMSCMLAFVIYTLFAWLPNFVAFLLTATMLCAFGQYDTTVKKRKVKEL